MVAVGYLNQGSHAFHTRRAAGFRPVLIKDRNFRRALGHQLPKFDFDKDTALRSFKNSACVLDFFMLLMRSRLISFVYSFT
jgi:hypothetical protein